MNLQVCNDSSKFIYLEILRVIACYLVIFNHTGKSGFLLFTKFTPSDLEYWLYLFFSIFGKVASEVFLAISGALI